MSRAKIDRELTRQLDELEDQEPLSASFSLQSAGTRAVSTPEETERCVHDLLKKVEDLVGMSPSHYRVFKNIGSFCVTAPPAFIRKLSEQHEVETATASRQPEEMLIRPVSSEPVPEPTPEPPKPSRRRSKS